MNKERRKQIAALVEELNDLSGKLSDIVSQIEAIRDEEQEYFDNMPESLQSGEKGSAAERAIGLLEDAANELGLVDIEPIVASLEEASE